MFQSVDSDSESTSEKEKKEISLFGKMQSKSGKSGKENLAFSQIFSYPHINFGEKV
jgi:hypothetical protein